jgi:hypothetical protein
LHFLHAKVSSDDCCNAWVSDSLWQSAQSNHFLPVLARQFAWWRGRDRGVGCVQQGERMATWALRTCLLDGISFGASVTVYTTYHMIVDICENLLE